MLNLIVGEATVNHDQLHVYRPFVCTLIIIYKYQALAVVYLDQDLHKDRQAADCREATKAQKQLAVSTVS